MFFVSHFKDMTFNVTLMVCQKQQNYSSHHLKNNISTSVIHPKQLSHVNFRV